MPEAAYSHGRWQAERPLDPIGAQMNVMYAVAVALLDDAVLVDQRTHTHHEKAYDALPLDERLTTRVAVTFKDGSTREKTVAHPRGTGNRQLTN